MGHAEIAVITGRSKASVRNRCWRLGVRTGAEKWTLADLEILSNAYADGKFVDVVALARSLGRTEASIHLKASRLGHGASDRPRVLQAKNRVKKFDTPEALRADQSQKAKERIATQGHPRGALGLKHSGEAKEKMSKASAKWNASVTEDQRREMTIRGLKTKAANGTMVNPRPGASWKAGWRDIGGIRKYYRSKWEANYAYYLEWLRQKGQIAAWKHEPETFWFDGIKRGCVSYLPDFWVQEMDGAVAYHEVKGWMDDRSKTKIRRMAKYHPAVRLIVIDAKGYAALAKSVRLLVPGWEA